MLAVPKKSAFNLQSGGKEKSRSKQYIVCSAKPTLWGPGQAASLTGASFLISKMGTTVMPTTYLLDEIIHKTQTRASP